MFIFKAVVGFKFIFLAAHDNYHDHNRYDCRRRNASKNQLDKRETIVALTASGQERSDWLKGKAREQAHRFLEPLNIEEKQTLYTLLRKLTTRGSEN